MLICKQLVKKYLMTTAVDGVDLDIQPGHVYALLGPNGSGKTTLMKMIAGLVKPTSGELLFEGAPVGVASKAHVAYMPTEGYFFNYMTCRDVGRYMPTSSGISTRTLLRPCSINCSCPWTIRRPSCPRVCWPS